MPILGIGAATGKQSPPTSGKRGPLAGGAGRLKAQSIAFMPLSVSDLANSSPLINFIKGRRRSSPAAAKAIGSARCQPLAERRLN